MTTTIKILLIISLCLISYSLYAQQQTTTSPTVDTGLGVAVPVGAGGGGIVGAILMYLIQYFKGKKEEETLLITKLTEVHQFQKELKEDLEKKHDKMASCLMGIWAAHGKKYQDEQIPPPV